MKEFKVNPLNVIGSRRQECLLPHMEPIHSPGGMYRHDIINWVESNLKGRYWIGSLTKLENNSIVGYDAIAFEDIRETTVFLLSCPYLAKNKVA